MKNKAFVKTMAATLVAATLGWGTVAQADTQRPAFAPGLMLAEAAQAEHAGVKLSDEGLQALRAIYAARLAIFEGHPKEAEKLLAHAKTELEAAKKTAAQLAFKPKKASTDTLIPIDAQLSVADEFVYTPEKAAQIAKVNEHLKKGENKKAVEVLRDGGVAVNLTAVLLPLEPTLSAVEKATKLIGEDKFYEANLALKVAGDGVIVDSQSFLEWLEAEPTATKNG
ncbi:YfdX family protein [uncultured Thiodictyon sp.]|uniref:YfdX family protein n=1 Tax=uncultured Thiodictyon sp. TaxID=1846217 RepID=UPI0025CCE9F4|nr:YfdX family protein [uncultured Thiodictyon sp.]